MESIRDPALAPSGARRIEWARDRMPVLRAIATGVRASRALRGRRVGISLVLEPKTACLALALRDAGAEIAVRASASETDDAVAAALVAVGVTVFARSDAPGDDLLADRLLDWRPGILLDDGAQLIRRLHDARRDALAWVRGAAELTTSGVRRLHVLAAAGELAIPCLAVDNAPAKRLFDNGVGTGQACVMAIVDLTGIALAGRTVVVAGYGLVGRGVARHAAALGARVTVTEVNSLRALEAHCEGFAVRPLREVGELAHVLISATGVPGTIALEDLRALADGAVVAVAGGVDGEVAVAELRAAAERVEQPRPRVERLVLGDRSLTLLAGGEAVNTTAGEGNPVEIMDVSLSLQALAAERLALLQARLKPGVHALPPALDERVARAQLDALGIGLDVWPEESSS